jgi:hypothetical protein
MTFEFADIVNYSGGLRNVYINDRTVSCTEMRNCRQLLYILEKDSGYAFMGIVGFLQYKDMPDQRINPTSKTSY